MLIQCTKALLNQIGIKENELTSPDGHEQFPNSLMAWNANVVSLYKGDAIVLMNNETRYSVVIFQPKEKDFSNFSSIIREAIKVALLMEGVRQDVIDVYFAQAGDVAFSKTSSKSMLAKMNNAVREVEFMQEYVDEETTIQRYISIVTNRFLQGSKPNEESFYPIEKMLYCLGAIALDEKESEEELLDVDLYQLKIEINLEGHEIWRRVLVPSTYSFRHLHNVIQTVFDWQNYHLHEFEVKGRDESDKSLLIVMDDNPDTLAFIDFDQHEICQERFVALKDVFPVYRKVNYMYDFGDMWEHTIIFEKAVKSHSFHAIYVDGHGERPPEDVGGQPGFERYIRVINNPQDPMYEEMIAWAKEQKERKLSKDQINRGLRLATRGYTYVPLHYQ